jgi:hypothetical protein
MEERERERERNDGRWYGRKKPPEVVFVRAVSTGGILSPVAMHRIPKEPSIRYVK